MTHQLPFRIATLSVISFGIMIAGLVFLNPKTVGKNHANQPPNAGSDTYSVHRVFSEPAPGVLVNDTDPDDLLKRTTDSNSSTTLFDRQYTYNTARQISQIIEPSRSRTFGYDNADRLTSVTDATHGNESYAFDDVGNRLSSHRASAYGYQSGQFNRLISETRPTQTVTYSHDANGNTTSKADGTNFWRYTWDYENRLSRAATRKQAVGYKFDALGRRVQRFVVGAKENTKFSYDGDDVLVDDNGGTLTKYLNGVGIDEKLRVQTGSSINYFLADHLGSTNGLTGSL